MIVPSNAPPEFSEAGPFRPLHLRKMALTVLRREKPEPRRRKTAAAPAPVHIVSYNVHSCVGLDGRLSPGRIARVLAMLAPDVIALQELDVKRTAAASSIKHKVANALEMQFHFYPSFEVEQEQYGNAILSRLPMQLIRAGGLPCGNQCWEPRGAMWVTIDVAGTPLQFFNTHLGLSPLERQQQVKDLLGPQWLGCPDCRGPVVLCGDFNSTPRSPIYRTLCKHLADAQSAVPHHRPCNTWYSPFPLRRIDHLFVNSELRVQSVEVPRTRLARVASDHLPLRIDLELMQNTHAAHQED